MTKQLNVELPETDVKRIKKDAIEMDVPLNEYALQAFQVFLSKGINQRRVYFDTPKQKKKTGRKIST